MPSRLTREDGTAWDIWRVVAMNLLASDRGKDEYTIMITKRWHMRKMQQHVSGRNKQVKRWDNEGGALEGGGKTAF